MFPRLNRWHLPDNKEVEVCRVCCPCASVASCHCLLTQRRSCCDQESLRALPKGSLLHNGWREGYVSTMQSEFIYDCHHPFVTFYALRASRCTGKERDTESGLDYSGARYYASSMGRFMTPDPSGLAYASIANPQSFNLYSYAQNNPLKYTDPTGLFCYYGDTGGGAQQDADNADSSQWDYHSSQSECETADENGNKGVWTNDDFTHPDANGDMVDDDGRPELYTIGAHTPIPDDIMNAVQNTLSAVQANGSYLNGIQNYSAMDVFKWSWRGVHHPNGPHGVYWHGNWCGAGGSGSPVDAQDGACLVHDFLYKQYGYTAGSNLNGYNPGLQEINQGLCDTSGSTLITAYFNFGVQTANLDPTNISNPSCHQ